MPTEHSEGYDLSEAECAAREVMSGEIAPALPQTLSYAASSAGIAAWQESRRRYKTATKALDAAADALRAEQKRVAAQAKTRRRNTTNQATLRAGRRAVD